MINLKNVLYKKLVISHYVFKGKSNFIFKVINKASHIKNYLLEILI